MSERWLLRLIDVRFKPPGGGDWLELARGAPCEFDREGTYVAAIDLAALFGTGVAALEGAEVELRVRWVPAPTDETDELDS